MPPSPSPRSSPGHKFGGESHKRGRSLEGGFSFKQKDDDLTLFNEMHSKDQDNFLLQSADDFDDLLSTRLKPFADYKLGINIPSRGESSDILHVDGDKNDYDWLLTPPETPLFPKLDDEPTPVNFVHNGRPRTRPISLSRSSTMEKSYRSGRASASPQRSSISPRSSTGAFQSRGRSSSASCSSPSPSLRSSTPTGRLSSASRSSPSPSLTSPTPTGRPSSASRSSPNSSLRSSTPTRRPSPPPIKPSTPPARISSPTSARLSNPTSRQSGAMCSSSTRGISPVRANRGNSSSPEVKTWQSNFAGFSLEAPPNLRTSLADQPAFYVRGSSPASRNSTDSISRVRRLSMSPTASRSIGSSHSHEHDQFSTNSRGSVASSGDDDVDSLLSVPMSRSDHSTYRRGSSPVSSKRPVTFSKKASRPFSPSSAPKRSFDTAIRQMDRKNPQNMFRPLMSNVPSSSLYNEGTISTYHHSMISKNSSITSNASSDQATSGAPDTEGSEHNQDDVTSGYRRLPPSGVKDEIFSLDRMDVLSEDVRVQTQGTLPMFHEKFHEASMLQSDSATMEELSHANANIPRGTCCETGYIRVNESVNAGCCKDKILCSICCCNYEGNIELVEGDNYICPECKQKEGILLFPIPSGGINHPQDLIDEVERSTIALVDASRWPETSGVDDVLTMKLQAPPKKHNEMETWSGYEEPGENCFINNSNAASTGVFPEAEVFQPPSMAVDQSTVRSDLSICSADPPLKTVEGEGMGNSAPPLMRSGSNKGSIVQSRSFTTRVISDDDPSYARQSSISMKSSIGYGTTSTSSSIDMSSRQGKLPWQRQLSSKRTDDSFRPRSTGSSFSGTSSPTSQGLDHASCIRDEGSDTCQVNGGQTVTAEVSQVPPDAVSDLETKQLLDGGVSLPKSKLLAGEASHINTITLVDDTSALESSGNDLCAHMDNSSNTPQLVDGGSNAVEDVCSPKNVEIVRYLEDEVVTPYSLLVGVESVQDHAVDNIEVVEASLCQNNFAPVSEIQIEDCHPSSVGIQIEGMANDSSQEHSDPPQYHKDSLDSILQIWDSDPAHGIGEEATVLVEDQGGRRTRSLTLEEATDTILFCSSIVQNLAYEAASIAIEKEKENLVPLEGSRPMISIVGSERGLPIHGRRSNPKRIAKFRKAKQKQANNKTEKNNPLSTKSENNVDGDRSDDPVIRNVGFPRPNVDSMDPPKLESKCNCTIM